MKEELKVIISAEIDKLKQNINSAKQQINPKEKSTIIIIIRGL